MTTATADDVQLVTPDEPPFSDVEYIEITDPRCRNGWFGQATEKDDLIELRQVMPEELLAAQRAGQHPPDSMLNAIPGKAVVKPDHPALYSDGQTKGTREKPARNSFYALHGDHATFKELKLLPKGTVEEQVQVGVKAKSKR